MTFFNQSLKKKREKQQTTKDYAEKIWESRLFPLSLQVRNRKFNFAYKMTYLNQFHKEAVERKLRKIAESMKSPMNSIDAANYMKRNFELAKTM